MGCERDRTGIRDDVGWCETIDADPLKLWDHLSELRATTRSDIDRDSSIGRNTQRASEELAARREPEMGARASAHVGCHGLCRHIHVLHAIG
jgi:hypothetical protein